MASERVTARQASMMTARSAIDVHTPGVTDGLVSFFAPVLEAGESLPDLAFLQRLLGRGVEQRYAALVAADDALDEALSRERRHRRGGREAMAEVRDLLRHLRLLDRADGERPRGRLAIPEELPRKAAGLLRHAEVVVRRIDRAEPVDARQREQEEGYAKTLRTANETLRHHHRQLPVAIWATHEARDFRDRLLEDFNEAFTDGLDVLVGLYRLSGHPQLAEALVPARQEKGLTLGALKRRRAASKAGRRRRKRATPAPDEGS